MAENKKSFIAYSDWYAMFKQLPDEVAGKLIKHIFSYVNDENPISDDYVINALFEQVKLTLKRDLIKWEEQRKQRSEAGKKSAKSRVTKFNDRSTTVNEIERNSTVNCKLLDVTSNNNINNIVESIDYDDLLKYINDTFGRNFKVITDKVKNKYKSLFKQGYTKQQIKEAIDNVKVNNYHKDTNYQYCTLEFFSRPDTIDKYSSVKTEINTTGSKEIDLLIKYKGIPLHEIPFDDRTPVAMYRNIHIGYE